MFTEDVGPGLLLADYFHNNTFSLPRALPHKNMGTAERRMDNFAFTKLLGAGHREQRSERRTEVKIPPLND